MSVDTVPLVGCQTPRISCTPAVASSAGDEAIKLGESVGIHLDEWQQNVLRDGLGELDNGNWASTDVALVVSRQNGKNEVLVVRELAGLFLFDERLIIHTAHEMKAAAVTFRRITDIIHAHEKLRKRVKNISHSKGDESIELHSGAVLRFMARTGGSGRSFSADVLILDEAYNLPDHVMAALTPTLAARPNPQTWYTSSAVNQLEHPHGLTLARVRRRALAGGDDRLTYAEWSGDEEEYARNRKAYALDPRTWAIANPALGTRVTEKFLGDQARRMGPTGFAVEHLSIGDWPDEPSTEKEYVVEPTLWGELVDRFSVPLEPFAFGVGAAMDRSSAAICAAGYRSDGLVHVEVIDQRPGTSWVVDAMKGFRDRNNPCAIVVDPGGPAGPLIKPLINAGLEIEQPTARDYAQACGNLYTAATERTDAMRTGEVPVGGLRHQDDARLTLALENVQTRKLAETWAWDARIGTVDISPLIGVTLAMHGLAKFGSDTGEVNLW